MGRGERPGLATRSASSLLFGPRTPRQTIQTKDGASDAQLKEALVSLGGGDANQAIDLMLRFNDQSMDESEAAEQLAGGLGDYIGANKLSEPEWQKLIDGLSDEIDKDGSVKAFDNLAQPIEKAFIDKLTKDGPGISALQPFERRFMLETDHQIPDQITSKWARAFPKQGINFGISNFSGEAWCSDNKALLARQRFYHAAYHQPYSIDRELAEEPGSALLDKKISGDLQAGNAGLLVEAIARDLRNNGGKQLFSSTLLNKQSDNLSDPAPAGYNQSEIIDHLIKHSPPQAQQVYLKDIDDFLTKARKQAVELTVTSDDLTHQLGLTDNGQAALAHEQVDWMRQGTDQLSRAALYGRRQEVIGREMQRVTDLLAAHTSPDQLAEMPLFKSDLDDESAAAWQQFHSKYLDRGLLPDRKLGISQDAWRQSLANAIETVDGNPFAFTINRARLLNNLGSYADLIGR